VQAATTGCADALFLIVDLCRTELGHLGQHVRRHIPVLTVFGDDGYGLAIALRNSPFEFSLSVRSEGHDFTDVEIGHLGLDFYIAHEFKSQKYLLVQIDELCFRQLFDVGHDDAKFFIIGENAELGEVREQALAVSLRSLASNRK
jgi:hypothetical protein